MRCLICYDKTGLDNKRRKVIYTKLFQAFCRKEFCLSAGSAFKASKILSNLNSNYYLKCFYLFLLSFTKLGKIIKKKSQKLLSLSGANILHLDSLVAIDRAQFRNFRKVWAKGAVHQLILGMFSLQR